MSLNKLMLFPIVLLFMMAVASAMQGMAIDDSTTSVNNTDHSDPPAVWNLWGLIQTDADENASNTFIWSAVGILALIVTAIAVASAAGVNVLGSGLSTRSQSMLFVGIFWLPLWGGLSIVSNSILVIGADMSLGTYFWLGLTFMFAIGIAIEINNMGD